MIALDFHLSSFLVVYFLVILIEYFVWRRMKKKRITFLGIMVISLYAMILFKITVCPIVIIKTQNRQEFIDMVGSQLRYFQPVPFKTVLNTIHSSSGRFQIIGNIFLLFPVPVLCALVGEKINIAKWIIAGGAMSLCIEIVQLIINILFIYPSHVADIDDLILNIIGIVCASLLMTVFYHKDIFRKLKSYFVVRNYNI